MSQGVNFEQLSANVSTISTLSTVSTLRSKSAVLPQFCVKMGSSRKDIMPEDHINLQEFDISPTLGFLSSSPPITRLPEEYDSWEHILSDLPRLIAQGQLEKTIKSLRSLETTYLTSELQWKRAYVLLAFIIHAYIWGQRKVIDTVPTELAEPFLQICAHFRMQPALSYAGLCLWNWGTKLEGSYDLGNLWTSASFTGTADEAAFYLIPVMIESEGGHLVQRLLNVIEAASREEWDVVSTGLKHCEATLRRMIDVLALMNAHCDPMVFFSQIRPFLAGPNVKFARANGEELHVTCVGGSGAQSTLFMSIDRLLGVTHDSTLFQVGCSPRQAL